MFFENNVTKDLEFNGFIKGFSYYDLKSFRGTPKKVMG